MEELLIILLDNAIKYTEKGSVSVSAVWDDELVRLSVRDTGIGIAEEDLPYVFDRFYKVDKAHSGKGSGLGFPSPKSCSGAWARTSPSPAKRASEPNSRSRFTSTASRRNDSLISRRKGLKCLPKR